MLSNSGGGTSTVLGVLVQNECTACLKVVAVIPASRTGRYIFWTIRGLRAPHVRLGSTITFYESTPVARCTLFILRIKRPSSHLIGYLLAQGLPSPEAVIVHVEPLDRGTGSHSCLAFAVMHVASYLLLQ